MFKDLFKKRSCEWLICASFDSLWILIWQGNKPSLDPQGAINSATDVVQQRHGGHTKKRMNLFEPFTTSALHTGDLWNTSIQKALETKKNGTVISILSALEQSMFCFPKLDFVD